jgi:hypothetical protein
MKNTLTNELIRLGIPANEAVLYTSGVSGYLEHTMRLSAAQSAAFLNSEHSGVLAAKIIPFMDPNPPEEDIASQACSAVQEVLADEPELEEFIAGYVVTKTPTEVD